MLGILGIVFCAVLAPIAWYKGAVYRSTCRALEVPPNGLATAGWALGIVETMLLAVWGVMMIAVMLMNATH